MWEKIKFIAAWALVIAIALAILAFVFFLETFRWGYCK